MKFIFYKSTDINRRKLSVSIVNINKILQAFFIFVTLKFKLVVYIQITNRIITNINLLVHP